MNNFELLTLMHLRELPRRWDQPTAGDWADILTNIPLFAGLSGRSLRKLVRDAEFAEFVPGETIIFAGDPGNWLYIILWGHAKARSGRVARALPASQYFGELALIDGRPHTATVVAMSYLHVMKLPSRDVANLARRDPAMTITMLRNLNARFRHLEKQVVRAA